MQSSSVPWHCCWCSWGYCGGVSDVREGRTDLGDLDRPFEGSGTNRPPYGSFIRVTKPSGPLESHTRVTGVRIASSCMPTNTRLSAIVVALVCSLTALGGGSGQVGAAHPGMTSSTPLNVAFTFTAYGSCDGGSAPVPFHSNVTGGLPPYNYYWNFGDGSPSSGDPDPVHTYANSFGGPYNVTLTVKDAAGSTASRTQTLLFLFPPCPSRAQFPVLLTPLEFVVVGGAVAALATAVVLAHRGRGPRP